MPRTRPAATCLLLALAVLALALQPPARAQTFTRVNDPAIAALVAASSSASWVDADGDGDLDLFVTTWSAGTPNVLFRNDGTGTFLRDAASGLEAVTAESFGSSWADVDNDGDAEPFVSQLFSGGGVLFANPGGPFVAAAGPLTDPALKGNASWGEFDGDGDVDLVVACLSGTGGITTANRLFLGDGAGGFAERDTGALAGVIDTHHTVTWADYDGDGDSDLFFATGGVGTAKADRLWRNMLRETGSAFLVPLTGVALATDLHDSQLISWADVDNDGDLDAYVLNYTTFANMLYRNEGDRTFTRLSGVGPIATDLGQSHGAAWGDYDNDGDLDVHVARDGGQVDRFYRNHGDGTFAAVTTGELVTLARSNWNSVAGDMDRDGDLDLFVPVRDANGPGLLYRNDLASGAHWLEVALVGVASNRSALGARLRARASIGGVPRWQLREISASTGYGGHGMLDAHFGLGDATVVDSLLVEWPSGGRDTLLAVPVDRALTWVEGRGLVGVPPVGRAGARLDLGAPVPNPARGSVRFDAFLDRAGPVRLDLHDVRGRRRAVLHEGRHEAGRHVLAASLPASIPPGIYYARLVVAGASRARRVVVTGAGQP